VSATVPALTHRRRLLRGRAEHLLYVPASVVVGITVLVPIAYTIWLSTRSVDLSSGEPWGNAGLSNYTSLATDPEVHAALLRTVFFASITVSLSVCVGFAIALIINQRFWGRAILLVLALVPWAISPVANGIFWRYIYDPDFGFLNSLLKSAHIIDTYQQWLADPTRALALAAVADSWKFAPFGALILLVALEAIPDTVYRAARIDGANTWQVFRHVTLPGVRRALIVVAVFQTIVTLQTFDLIYVLTSGGPGTDTTVVNLKVFREAFEAFNLGRAAALGLTLAAITLAFGALVSLIGHRRARQRTEEVPS
jgi:multiple sugar transport system permease protein